MQSAVCRQGVRKVRLMHRLVPSPAWRCVGGQETWQNWQGQGITEAQGTNYLPVAADGASRYEELWTVYRQPSDTKKRCEKMEKVCLVVVVVDVGVTGKAAEQAMLSETAIYAPKRGLRLCFSSNNNHRINGKRAQRVRHPCRKVMTACPVCCTRRSPQRQLRRGLTTSRKKD